MKLPKHIRRWTGLVFGLLGLIAGLAIWLRWRLPPPQAPAELPAQAQAAVPHQTAAAESSTSVSEQLAEPQAPVVAAALPSAAAPAPAMLSPAPAAAPGMAALPAPDREQSENPPPAEGAPAQIQTDGLRGSARMYAAHAPLRAPEVADPDSATNKKIMQTMVLKALRANTPEPTQARHQEGKR